jgi:hypothetical protein
MAAALGKTYPVIGQPGYTSQAFHTCEYHFWETEQVE